MRAKIETIILSLLNISLSCLIKIYSNLLGKKFLIVTINLFIHFTLIVKNQYFTLIIDKIYVLFYVVYRLRQIIS